MADNTELNPGTGGDIAATDDIGGVKYQRVKLVLGADGVNDGDVESGNPMPVTGVVAVSNSITVTDGSGSLTVDGTVNVSDGGGSITVDGALTSIATITNVVHVDDNASTLSIDDGAGSITVDYATTGSGNATGALRVELANNGTGLVGLNAGTNAIGKLAANNGVDIGDVDVTSIAAGTNAIGNVGIIPRASGGLTTYHLASAGTVNQVAVKGSAGQLFGWYIYNSNAAARKVAFHNTTTPSAGASVLFSLVLPPSSAANAFSDVGIPFSTGIGISTVTGLADNDTAAVAANDLIINLWYA